MQLIQLDKLSRVNVMGVRIDVVALAEILGKISKAIQKSQHVIISYANIHALNLAYKLPWFHGFLNRSDLVFCDGFGVQLGARILGQPVPPRYTPPDWIPQLCAMCAEQGISLFFLGAQPGAAECAASRLKERYPDLCIAGTHHGYFDKTPGSAENEAVVAEINRAHPNILLVGFGMPLQERWLMENWEKIDAHVAIPVGAAIDYLAGVTPRAPRWITDHGLEWLGRLVIEPRRLWKRYLVGNPLFFYRVLKQRLGLLHLD